MDSRRRRRFAVLNTGKETEYPKAVPGGYAKLLESFLRDGWSSSSSLLDVESDSSSNQSPAAREEEEEDEDWEIFPLLDGDFSFMERAESFDGFVVTGSAADAHGGEDWVLRLCESLRRLHRKGKRVLGVCFGHQVLARALGGDTGRADAAVGWEVGVKRIAVDSRKVEEMLGVAGVPSSLFAVEIHQDQVSTLPPGAALLASSERTGVEMFAVDDNVLGMQFHPEFTKDVLVDILRIHRGKTIGVEVADEAMRSLEENQPDQEALRELCKAFLKGPPRGCKAIITTTVTERKRDQ